MLVAINAQVVCALNESDLINGRFRIQDWLLTCDEQDVRYDIKMCDVPTD